MPASIKFSKCVSCSAYFNRLLIPLQEHPGRVHFATDAWTSPNHRAFVAWTVHLHHNGHVLAFVLDIVEVPEVRYPLVLPKTHKLIMFQSHTGEALAQAFHDMLVEHALVNKVWFTQCICFRTYLKPLLLDPHVQR